VTPPTFLRPLYYIEQIFLHSFPSFFFFVKVKNSRNFFSLIIHTKIQDLGRESYVIRRVV
jgi:hypothetical protein